MISRQPSSVIVRQYAHTLSFTAVKIVATVLLVYIVGKNLTPAENSDYTLIRSTVETGAYLLGMDLYVYLSRYIPGRPAAEGVELFKSVFVVEVILAVLVFCLMVGLNIDRKLAGILHISNWKLYRLGLLLLVVGMISAELLRLFKAFRRIEVSNYISFLRTHSWVFVLGLVCGEGHANLSWILGLWLVGMLLAAAYGLWRLDVVQLVRAPIDLRIFQKAIAFSWPVFASTLGSLAIRYLDVFALSLLLSPQETGIYAYVRYIINVGILFTATMVEDVLAAYIVASYNLQQWERAKALLTRLLKYALATVIAFIVLFGVAHTEILSIMAKAEYLAASRIVPVLLLGTLIRTFYIPFRLVLLLNERVGLLAKIELSGAALTLGLNLALIPRLSILGPAIAIVVANSWILGWALAIGRRYRLVHFGESKAANLLSAGAITAALLSGLRIGLSRSGIISQDVLGAVATLAITCVACIVTYLAGLFAFRVVDFAEISYAKELVMRAKGYLVGER